MTATAKPIILFRVNTSHGPKYRYIAASIQDLISSGELLPGEKLPTFRTLADRHGVTIETVSRAVAYLSERGLVHTRHGAGSFVNTNDSEDHGSHARTDTILTLVHDEFLTEVEGTPVVSNYWLEALVSAITRASGRLGLKSQLSGFSHESALHATGLAERIHDAVGIMLIGDPDQATLRFIADTGVPLCRVNRTLPDWFHARSFTAHYGTTALHSMANYLLSLGHRQLVFVQDSEDRFANPTTTLRRSVFSQCIEAWGGNPASDFRFMHISMNPNDATANAEALQSHMSAGATAAACYNDASAIAVYQAAHLLGLRIPEELSVTGHDGLAVTDILNPPLTTVQFDNLSLATNALRTLLEISHGKAVPASPLETEGSLIIRRSATVPYAKQNGPVPPATTPRSTQNMVG